MVCKIYFWIEILEMNDEKIQYLNITYYKRRSNRAKRVFIKIDVFGDVVVIIPSKMHIDQSLIDKLLNENMEWILKNVEKIKDKRSNIKYTDKDDYLKYKDLALDIIRIKIEYFNTFYNLPLNKISIRNQRTKWGSCSSSGNLSFNYRLCFLPDNLSDYIVVHELCHLAFMDHSQYFWDKVSITIPDYILRRKNMAQYSSLLY